MTLNGSNAWLSRDVTVSATNLVSTTISVSIPLNVIFNAVPCKPSLFARFLDNQEFLQAVSHKTKAVVSLPEELVICKSVT